MHLNNEHKARATDLELFGQLKAFSWLSNLDKSHLVSALEIANFTKREVVLRESELASYAHILLAGAASLLAAPAIILWTFVSRRRRLRIVDQLTGTPGGEGTYSVRGGGWR